MGKTKLSPQTKGWVVRRIMLSIKGDMTIEDAYTDYMSKLSPKMQKYDIDSEKTEILDAVKQKINTLAKVSTGETSAKSSPSKSKSEPPKETKKALAKPLAIRVKGEVDLIEDEEGVKVKKTAKTKKVALYCPDGSHGEKLNDDEAGCVFD